MPMLMRSTGLGSLAGAAVMAITLAGMMYAKTEIEWQDRAWRLLENEGQRGVDEWSLGGWFWGLWRGGLR